MNEMDNSDKAKSTKAVSSRTAGKAAKIISPEMRRLSCCRRGYST